MQNSGSGNDRGNMERMGESAGAMAGRAADFGMEVTGALFRSAAQMFGGWWSSDEPRQAAGAWSDQAESRCRSHFQSNARGSAGSGSASGGMHASGSVGGASGSVAAGGAAQSSNVAPKSQHAAMQSAGEVATDTGSGSGTGGIGFDASARIGDTKLSGSAHVDAQSSNRQSSQPSSSGSAGAMASDSSAGGGVSAAGRAQVGGSSMEGAMSMDSATDGFEHARPGYQLGYIARRNPSYQGRSFNEIEPELQRIWESRAQTEGGSTGSRSSWPEVRGFVDFAYQQGE